MTTSFIERQFPVSKISKESYKERKANNGQTLTGLGKWWGRKPLILCRAAILGCLMPASDDPKKDNEIFLKILSMDTNGLVARKQAAKAVFAPTRLRELLQSREGLWRQYAAYFSEDDKGRLKISRDAPREEMELAAFNLLGYDEKIAMGVRPEHLGQLPPSSWTDINAHFGTTACTLPELVEQLAQRRYGHSLRVGDCFCGGGSIPFEAARIGCKAYGSDLNPVAGLLTWAAINVCGANDEQLAEIRAFQERVYEEVDAEIQELGIESRVNGDRAVSYLYCVEAKCPECGKVVPLAPSWVIGKGTKTVVEWRENAQDGFDPVVTMGVDAARMKAADEAGTATSRGMKCPHCHAVTPISVLRKDHTDTDGSTVYGLRKWDAKEFEPRLGDVYHERLYAIKYEHRELLPNGKVKTTRYYQAPDARDLANEKKVHDIVAENFSKWQAKGFVPSMVIDPGDKTDELTRNRGWAYWHELFNCRQLLTLESIVERISYAEGPLLKTAGILGVNKLIDNNCKRSSFCNASGIEKVIHSFYNQSLCTLTSYGANGSLGLPSVWLYSVKNFQVGHKASKVMLSDARAIKHDCDLWITDPPYADAVNYHELSEFFLAWDKSLLRGAFPEWYTDSKRALAVRGDEHFSQTMIDIYRNLNVHMSEDGLQVVMFTHSDPAVWAQLALIMWKAGLMVTAAWNIATETDASGLKSGNYVKGTVLLVLRKQTGEETAFLDEIEGDIREEVRRQIDLMQRLDPREDPNFSDPDYILAAYAASLKVLTGYRSIGEITDFDYELDLAINDPAKSEVVKLIDRARELATNCTLPRGIDLMLWRDLSGAERFYIKGVDAEKHGLHQVNTYQEYARVFGLSGAYTGLMASAKANEARLRTASELGLRSFSDVAGFDGGLLRKVLESVHVAVKETEAPEKGFAHLKTVLGFDYWPKREAAGVLLEFLAECESIASMDYWHMGARAAKVVLALVRADHV